MVDQLEQYRKPNKPKRVKIISIGFAAPEFSYTQEQIFNALGYPKIWWRMFRESGIDKRHFVLPFEKLGAFTFQQQQEIYKEKSIELCNHAVTNCLDGRKTDDIGCIVYGSCTGFVPGPTIPHYLIANFKFPPNTYATNISGQGCEGAFPNLKRAIDFVKANDKPALTVNCEISSLCFWSENTGTYDNVVVRKPDPENDYEVLRAHCIFADMATATLLGDDDDWRHPEIIDTETYTDTKYLDELGFVWRNGLLRVVVSRNVPGLVPVVVKPAVDNVLKRQGMELKDIKWWIIHAGGKAIIDVVGKCLNLTEEDLRLSRETLRLYGNTSSTSVGVTGKRLMSENIKPGEYVAAVTVGPGMTGGMSLLRFPQQ